MSNDRDYMEANRRNWDERVPVHFASAFYDVESFQRGRSSLMPVERREVGEVRGKTLLHLQCHFGMDTLSWAREGAIVTGIDFSRPAIEQARRLAAELGIEARFVESNLYDLPANLSGEFDIVFTSYGALYWLPDIKGWANVAASFVKPGGFLYVVDGHPGLALVHNEPYFPGTEPLASDDVGTYTDPQARFENTLEYGFQHTLGDIVTALIEAGLRIDFLHEFPFGGWQMVPEMVKGDDGYYRSPDEGRLPLLFSVKATKLG